MILIGSFPTNLRNYLKDLNPSEQRQEPIIQYEYRCYKCVKDNHETDVYETNSKSDYEDIG